MKLKTLHPEFFISDCLECSDYYCTCYPLTCPTSENCLGLDLAVQ